MKPFSEENGWYYSILAILSTASAFPFIWMSYMCVKTGEYWPFLLFGVVIVCMLFSAYGLFCKARNKFREDRIK